MNIKGEKIQVSKSSQFLYDFLSNFSNFEKIMPENTSKFESSENGFLFALSGMPEVPLKLKEKIPTQKIVLTSAKESLNFTLEAFIFSIDDENSEVLLEFNGEFNPFIRMMVEKPLTNFISSLTENIKKL